MMSNASSELPPVIANRIFVLVLQHPQERHETLATAGLLRAGLSRIEIRPGLSWPNLPKALGRPMEGRRVPDPSRWAVLYLGSAKAAALKEAGPVIAVDRQGRPLSDQEAALRGVDGIVLIDGSWKEAKTLWWRNPWLLRLRRIVLNPSRPSRYGRMRREPRSEALSTLEAAAMLLARIEGRPEIETGLIARFERLLAESRPPARSRAETRSPAPADIAGDAIGS